MFVVSSLKVILVFFQKGQQINATRESEHDLDLEYQLMCSEYEHNSILYF